MTGLPSNARIGAVIFDMDGTLVDSESFAARSINRLLGQHRLPPAEPDSLDFYGITWRSAARILVERYPTLPGDGLEVDLQREFHRLFVEEPPPYIAGAEAAMADACRRFPTAVVTSSNRETVEHLIRRMEIQDALTTFVAAEDVGRSKPHPEGFLLAAQRLGCDPGTCLVFEDSDAGLQAAKAAGMWTVAITASAGGRGRERAYADLVVCDYTALAADFFALI